MTKKQVAKLKRFVDTEWEYIIANNYSGIDLWYDIDDSWDNLCREFRDVRSGNWATEDELDEVKDYFREQFVKNIEMKLRGQQWHSTKE